MSLCPNDCQSGQAQPVFVKIDSKEFAEPQAEALRGRRGVREVEYDVLESAVGFEVVIIQEAYDTKNFFKYRRKFEQDSLSKVRDFKDSAEVVVQAPFAVKATQCSNCGAVYDSMEGRVFDNPHVFGLADQFVTVQ